MTTTPTLQRNLLSQRSRRLRTVGAILLIAVVGMTLYGTLVLMPTIGRAVRRDAQIVTMLRAGGRLETLPQVVQGKIKRTSKAAAAQTIFAYAYWTTCVLLVTALILIAWMDVREVQRRYIDQRTALFMETVQNIKKDRTDRLE